MKVRNRVKTPRFTVVLVVWFWMCRDNELKSLNYQNSFISVNGLKEECLILSIGWSLRSIPTSEVDKRYIRSWSFSKRFSKFQDIFRIKFWKIQLSKMQCVSRKFIHMTVTIADNTRKFSFTRKILLFLIKFGLLQLNSGGPFG